MGLENWEDSLGSGGGLIFCLMKETMGVGGVYEAKDQVASISIMGKAKEAKLILKVAGLRKRHWAQGLELSPRTGS